MVAGAPVSAVGAPNGRWLRLTVKVGRDHTADLQRLPRHPDFAEGPWGSFTPTRRIRRLC